MSLVDKHVKVAKKTLNNKRKIKEKLNEIELMNEYLDDKPDKMSDKYWTS